MSFDIPIVFFIFKRKDKSVEIIRQLSNIKPKKLYLISDAGRNDEEKELVEECRNAVLNSITWDCEIIKNFADENKGCFDRIGLGALWVFSQEEVAIFLEDDNYPELSFFTYCAKMLEQYKDNERVMWICGTNYLEKYKTDNTYIFTQHMHPCGWASWSNKFTKYYDKDFSNLNKDNIKAIKKKYVNKRLFRRDYNNWMHEIESKKINGRFTSWDYQMSFSLRYYDLLGIVPSVNLIKNIGVDDCSIHGGNSFDNIMTKRFCGMESLPLRFPLLNPEKIEIDKDFDKKVDKVVLPPKRMVLSRRIKRGVAKTVHLLLFVPLGNSIKETLAWRKEYVFRKFHKK